MSLDRVGYRPETKSWSIVTAATTPAVISGTALLDIYIFTNAAVLGVTLPSATLVYPGARVRVVNNTGAGLPVTSATAVVPATSVANGAGVDFLCIGSTGWRAL